jgi:Trypsin-like serine proteases, typically periplasmic, contain C-terminal PDZ domain
MVKRVVDQLVDKGKVVRGWLGVSLQPLSAELADSLGVPGKQGAVVASTMPGGPAATAGLQQNDVILAFDKIPVEDYHHFQRLTAETRAGSKVVLQVLRKKKTIDLPVTVAEAPDEGLPRRPVAPPKS